MPDVRLKDGTIVRNVPEGITQSELMRRVQGARPTASVGPAPDDPGAMQKMYAQVHEQVEQGDRDIPLLQRESFHEKSIPVLGGMAGLLVPGAGWGALGLQSLMAGAGTSIGELFRQQQTREPVQPKKAVKAGGVTAAGNLAGGAAVKGLGALAKKIFSTPLSNPQQAAAGFAREQRAPFPLSSAAPGSPAGNIQQGTRALLPGEIKTQLDANKVAQFLNREVGTLTQSAKPIDEAATLGQKFLREVFEPGETVVKNTFAKYAEAVGDDVAIPTTHTLAAVQAASDQLANRGQTTGGLYQRLRTILKRNPESFTPKEFDELYGGIVSQAFTSKAKAGGEGRILLEAITRDLDEFGKPAGANFSDDIASANAVREQFRELRNIPGLERLGKDFGERGGTLGTRQWMAEMFSNPNGKALGELRARNPELYHELADSWLANHINRFSKSTDGAMGRTLDGPAFRAWFEQNRPALKVIYGAPQTQALDNFTQYASFMSGAARRAEKGFSPTELTLRAGTEGAAMFFKAPIMIPGEAASYVLAKGLSDPSSSLFKVFTQGFSPATRSFMVKSGELSGQAAARKADKENGED